MSFASRVVRMTVVSGLARSSPATMRNVQAAMWTAGRSLSTEHHRSDFQGPPPGFNAEQAKKPLPSTNKTRASQEAKSSEATPPAVVAEGGADAKSAPPAEPEVKLSLWERVKHEAHHYWDGTKLLAAEVRISSRLVTKMASGYELSRREDRQLRRTVQDVVRIVPFAVFVIIPFAELLLPFALKLFPGMLPSTFEAPKTKEAKARVLRATRKDVSNFLQATLKETGIPIPTSISKSQREEFSAFFRKLRSANEKPSEEEVIQVCQMFKDDLTLDNLSRPQLISMCRYLNLSTFGNDLMLRYTVRHRMRQIKRDDKVISYEGVDKLSVSELQTACASRGIRTHSVSPARLRSELQMWLNLRLVKGVPSTLLVMSSAFQYSGAGEAATQIDALLSVLSSIPEELFHATELEVHDAEGSATNKQRLEVLKEQQELIDEENEQQQEQESTGFATPRDSENIDEPANETKKSA